MGSKLARTRLSLLPDKLRRNVSFPPKLATNAVAAFDQLRTLGEGSNDLG